MPTEAAYLYFTPPTIKAFTHGDFISRWALPASTNGRQTVGYRPPHGHIRSDELNVAGKVTALMLLTMPR